MKRSEYKKLLLEFLQLNESSGKKKSLLRETKYNVQVPNGDKYWKLKSDGDWEAVIANDLNFSIDTENEAHLNPFIDDEGDLQYTEDNETYAISKSHFTEVQEEEKTPQEKEAELQNSGYEYFGDVTIKSTSYIVWNKQGSNQLILTDEDAEKKYFFKDSSVYSRSPNIDDQLNNVTLTRDASGKPKSFDYVESDKNFSATIDTDATTPAQSATTTAKKKALSQSATGSIKEIQKIIKAPSSEDGAKLGDGKWGKKTQAAFVKYLNDNSEALRSKGIDDPSKFASDAAYMKEKLGNLSHPKNVKGVLVLLQSLGTEDGETTAATSKEDKDYLISLKFRNKYYKDENDDFYYVDADGRYVYKDTFEFEAFGAEPFASFDSKDKISVPGKDKNTTAEVSKWGNTVDKIHYKEWTEITEEEAGVLASKEEEAAPAAAPNPDEDASKTRRETRREKRKDRRKARLQKRLNKLQETNMNEKLINEMKKGKASLLNLLNEQVPQVMTKPEGGGGALSGWDKYSQGGEEHRKLADLWKKHAGKKEFDGKSKFKNPSNFMNFPGNYKESVSDFAKWYRHAQKSGQAMGTIGKKTGQEFSPKEAQTMLTKLVGMLDSGEEKGSTQLASTKELPFKSVVRTLKKKIGALGLDTDVISAYFDSLDEKRDKKEVDSLLEKIKSGATAEDVKSHINKLAGKEMFESLSRGALYRRRYHGRY